MSVKKETGFVRQSSWLVISTFVGGAFMALVHSVGRRMGPEEYSAFFTLLSLLFILGIPTMGLQTIFARQAAAVTNENGHRQLIATVRAIMLGTFLMWVLSTVIILAAMRPLRRLLEISNPFSIYFMILIGLTGLWVPIAKGVLQGQHRFFGLGWLQVTDGFGRFTVLLLLVLYFNGKAASGMFAALIGQVITICVGAWLTYDIWSSRPAVPFHWKEWLVQAIPLTLGPGIIVLMTRFDMLFVRSLFCDEGQTHLYAAASVTCFSIVMFIQPVALVMFARLVRNVANAERGESLGLTLWATAAFGVAAGIGCMLLPKLPLQLMFFGNQEMCKAAPLVPWFAWSLLPLIVANVLIQNILAHARYNAVLWLLLVPLGYAAALCAQAPALVRMDQFSAFIRVIQTLGLASTLLCLVAAWFSRRLGPVSVSEPTSEPAPAISGTASPPQDRTAGAAT
jgi:hypothetical protein